MVKRIVGGAWMVLAVWACEPPPTFDPPAGSYSESEVAIEGVGEARTIAAVDSTFFGPNLPMLGRLFIPREYATGASRVAVLHPAFWTEHMGERPEVIGTEIEVDGVTRTIVGIMPRGLDVPDGVVLWVPRDGGRGQAGGPGPGGATPDPGSGTVHEYAYLEDEVEHLLAFLLGQASLSTDLVEDSVALRVAPEGGGETATLTGDALRDPSAWRVGRFRFAPSEELRHRTLTPGLHSVCRPTELVTRAPDLAHLPHVGVRLARDEGANCLQTWNATFVFDEDAEAPRLVAVVYDQWEW